MSEKHVHPSYPGRIISVREETRWGCCTVFGIVDGSEIRLFDYYIDELSINAKDLIGMFPDEARRHKRNIDVAFLQS